MADPASTSALPPLPGDNRLEGGEGQAAGGPASTATAARETSAMPSPATDQPKAASGRVESEASTPPPPPPPTITTTTAPATSKPDAVTDNRRNSPAAEGALAENTWTPSISLPSAVPPPPQAGHAEDGVGALEFQGSVDSINELPSAETLKKIEDYTVQDRHAKSRTFKSLYNSRHVARRVLIIFVRHFFCGNCQEYLRALSASPITPARLLQLPVTTSIAIVGCGDPSLIDMYAAETGCRFPIYADPTRRLYESLGMVRTLQAGDRPHYQARSLLRNALDSIVQGLRQLPKGLATKSGDFRQIGGEFLFEPVSLRGRADLEGWGDVDRQMEHAVSVASSAPVAAGSSLGGGGGGSGSTGGIMPGEHGAKDPAGDEKPSLDGKRSSKSCGDEGDGEEVEEKRVTWCHRMKTTRDHAEMPELMEVLGLGGDDHQLLLQGSSSFGEKGKKRWSRAVGERKGPGLSTLTREMGAMTTEE